MTTTALRPYEALVIFKTAGTEQDLTRQTAHLEEQVKKVGGRIETTQSMGRRRLAFRIARQTEGHYYLLRFQAPTEQLGALDRLLRLNEAIVRFIILSQEDSGAQDGHAGPSAPATAKAGSAPQPSTMTSTVSAASPR